MSVWLSRPPSGDGPRTERRPQAPGGAASLHELRRDARACGSSSEVGIDGRQEAEPRRGILGPVVNKLSRELAPRREGSPQRTRKRSRSWVAASQAGRDGCWLVELETVFHAALEPHLVERSLGNGARRVEDVRMQEGAQLASEFEAGPKARKVPTGVGNYGSGKGTGARGSKRRAHATKLLCIRRTIAPIVA